MATKDISDELVCWAYMRSKFNGGDSYETPQQILSARTGECEKVCVNAMSRAVDRGFVEFGTSIQSGWLTSKGKELVRQFVMQEAAQAMQNDENGLGKKESLSCAAAQEAINAHGLKLGIEGDAEIQVWHLLVSLQEFCAASNMDFDKVLGETRAAMNSGEIEAPEWKAAEAKKVAESLALKSPTCAAMRSSRP